jgi:membrane protein DedA with SNARE-associated domain
LRVVAAIKGVAILLVAFHFRHRFHGPPFDYLSLAAAAAASWVGIPGPGEPLLIAAGVMAARHKLDIGSVLLVAWAAATAGGIAGWLIGIKAGRAVLTTRGPFHRARRRALARGEEVFGRWPVIAILLTPSWVAGIHGVGARVYLPTNAAGAAIWALAIGLGAYWIGPSIVDFADDLGWLTVFGLVAVGVVGVALELARRRRRAQRRKAAAAERATAGSQPRTDS